MAIDYAGLRDNQVLNAINNAGIAATLIVKGVSTVSADGGTITESSANHAVKVAFTDQRRFYQDGKMITDETKRVLLSPSGMTVEPKENDELLVNGETFKIIDIDETKPADVVVLYELVLEN